MSQHEALSYYTPFELCLLGGTESGCSASAAKHPGNLNIRTGLPIACNAGFQAVVHSDKACSSLSGFLMRWHSTKPWPASANLLDLIKQMNDHNSNTVVVVGDSSAGQMIGAAMCHLARYGLEVDHFALTSTYSGIKDGFRIMDKRLNQSANDAQVPFFQMVLIHFEPCCPAEYPDAQSFLEKNMFPHKTSWNRTIKGDIVYIVNYGLHFNSGDRDTKDGAYQSIVTLFLRFLFQNSRPNDTLIYRETTAQHFNSPSGIYDPSAKEFPYYKPIDEKKTRRSILQQGFEKSGLKARVYGYSPFADPNEVVLHPEDVDADVEYHCSPIKNESAMGRQNWKNHAASKVIQQLDPNSTRIHILPFYKITASRHDLHPQDNADCTHFCSSPMLYLPLWESLSHIYHRSRNHDPFV